MLQQAVQLGEDGEERGEGVRLVGVGTRGPFVEEGDAEVEVWEGGGGEGFYEDVDDYVWVVEVWVKLVAAVFSNRSEFVGLGGMKPNTYSLRMARLARQSYSSLRIWW